MLREKFSIIYETLYFTFPEEFRVVATPPNFYQNRVPLLNIKEGTHDKSKHQTFRFFPKKTRAIGRRLCLGGGAVPGPKKLSEPSSGKEILFWPSRGSGGMLPQKIFKIKNPRLAKNAFPENSAWKN